MSQGYTDAGSHCLLFSGHRIDAADRDKPRFPAETEAKAAALISTAISDELSRRPDSRFTAVCSAANGGDILFLEACVKLGVKAEIFLAKEPEEFAQASVTDAGQSWVDRYTALLNVLPSHVLAPQATEHLDIWQQTNLWMIETALSHAVEDITVITLWDGLTGDGPGGTRDMVMRARNAGVRVIHLDSKQLTLP